MRRGPAYGQRMKNKKISQEQKPADASRSTVAEKNQKEIVSSTAAIPNPKSQKRDNIFSKSRDTREDRGTRKMKTTHNSQTFSHVP